MSARRSSGQGRESRDPGPSQRQLRVGEQMRHLLAEILLRRELHDPALAGVSLTVSEVRVSPDLKNATVFLVELGLSELRKETLKGLIRANALLGGRVAREMHLKYAPRFKFVSDTSFAEADRVERLIAEETRRIQHQDDAP